MKAHTESREVSAASYEAPRIEQIMDPAQIEREVHYAGETSELTPR
jgi:hypothetical protein